MPLDCAREETLHRDNNRYNIDTFNEKNICFGLIKKKGVLNYILRPLII